MEHRHTINTRRKIVVLVLRFWIILLTGISVISLLFAKNINLPHASGAKYTEAREGPDAPSVMGAFHELAAVSKKAWMPPGFDLHESQQTEVDVFYRGYYLTSVSGRFTNSSYILGTWNGSGKPHNRGQHWRLC